MIKEETLTQAELQELIDKIASMGWINVLGDNGQGITNNGSYVIFNEVRYDNIGVIIRAERIISISMELYVFVVIKDGVSNYVSWIMDGDNVYIQQRTDDLSLIDFAYNCQNFIKDYQIRKLEGFI